MTRRNSDVEVSQTPLWNQHCLVTLTVLMGTPPCFQAFFSQWLFIHHEHHGWRSPRSKNPLLDLQKLSSNQYKEVCVSGNVFINDAVLKIKEYSSLPAPWCQTIMEGVLLEPGAASLCTLTRFLHCDFTQSLAGTPAEAWGLFSAMCFTPAERGKLHPTVTGTQ